MTHNPLRERMDGDVPLPGRKELEALFARMPKLGVPEFSQEELAELIEAAEWALHIIPSSMDFLDLLTRNPINQVYFRAGLLACREYLARFVEQGGDATTAASIRANWWPSLGDDPGAPRLYDFDEVATEIEKPDGGVRYESKDVPINVEALPRAYQFLLSLRAPAEAA